jgi:hypothetical protein
VHFVESPLSLTQRLGLKKCKIWQPALVVTSTQAAQRSTLLGIYIKYLLYWYHMKWKILNLFDWCSPLDLRISEFILQRNLQSTFCLIQTQNLRNSNNMYLLATQLYYCLLSMKTRSEISCCGVTRSTRVFLPCPSKAAQEEIWTLQRAKLATSALSLHIPVPRFNKMAGHHAAQDASTLPQRPQVLVSRTKLHLAPCIISRTV